MSGLKANQADHGPGRDRSKRTAARILAGNNTLSTLMMSTAGWSYCIVEDILKQSRSCTVSLKGRAFTSTGQASVGNHEKTSLCSWNRLRKVKKEENKLLKRKEDELHQRGEHGGGGDVLAR